MADPLKKCDGCQEWRIPEGGVQMSECKWFCVKCFRSAFSRFSRKVMP